MTAIKPYGARMWELVDLNGAIVTNYPMEPIELKRGEKMDGYMETVDMAVMLANSEDQLK